MGTFVNCGSGGAPFGPLKIGTGWLACWAVLASVGLAEDDRLVGGFEVEVGDLGQSGNTARSDGFATVSSSIDLGAYATFSGRLGVLVERDWLLYGRAGITVAELDARVTETATPSRSSTQDSTWGYTFGAGVERALSPQWSVRVEYQYTDFRTELALPDNGGPGPGWNHDADLHAIKLGLNMHF